VIDRSLDGVIDLIAGVVEDLTSEYPDNAFLGCGVAFPGVVDAVKGVVRLSTHFDWRDVPLRDKLASRLKKPTLIIDRPRAAIVGEKWYGAAKEAKDVIYIHIGTGIGAAFLIDGELHNGFTNTAGEIGHISIDPNGPPCRCGSKGCLELLASGQAIASRTMDRLRTGRSSILREWIDATGEAVTAKMVQTAVEQNDALALEVLEEAGGYLGIAIAMIINLLNPELVLIGGPVARFGEALLEPIRLTVKQRALSVPGSAARILISQLEPDAEQVGAAALLIQQVFGPSKQRLIVSGAHQALFI
jgi:glucokinase-like ROK family protein